MNPSQLKICSFNIENLFISDDPKRPTHPLEKSPEKVGLLAQVIKEINADIYFLCEVGGLSSLSLFNQNYLDSKYHCNLIPGNTDRGIEIAYLIKKTLPFDFQAYSHRQREIDFLNSKEIKENESRKIKNEAMIPSQKFSRDVAELRLFKKGEVGPSQIPILTLFGTHLKSKLDPELADFEGRGKREAEVKTLMRIAQTMYQHWQEKCPLIILGDFNGPAMNPTFGPEFKALWKKSAQSSLLFKDLLEVLNIPIEERYTFISVANPAKNIPLRQEQLDYILLSEELVGRVVKDHSFIYKFKFLGNTLPYPKTLTEKYRLPSDHYPLCLTLNI